MAIAAAYEHRKSSLTNLSDGTLVQETLYGNERAFEALIHRYGPFLFSFIYHLLGDYDRSCDVQQQVFLHLYHSLASLSLERPIKAWLFRVAHNCCIDEIRRKRTLCFSEIEQADEEQADELLEIVDKAEQPEEWLEQHDLQQHLLQAIGLLPGHYRRIVLLRYGAQLSFPEIGEALKIPPTTAKTYFYRAGLRLRKLLPAKCVSDLLPGCA